MSSTVSTTAPFVIPAAVTSQVDEIMAASRSRFGHGAFEMNAVIDRLEDQRRAQEEFIENLLNQVEAESRDLVDAETSNLTAARERIQQIDSQLEPLRSFEETRNAHRASRPNRGGSSSAGAGASTSSGDARGSAGYVGLGARTEPREHEYRTAGEILADGCRAAWKGDENARGRLESAGLAVQNEALVRTEARASAPHTTTAEVPGILTTSVVGQIMSDIDAARPFISSIGPLDLGGIEGETFKRPFVTQHVEVGKQVGQKTEVPDGQFKIGSVAFTKETYGGWTNVARQVLDWTSPAVWNALLKDFQEIYGLETEDDAADAFVTSVTAATATPTAGATPTVTERLTALYQGAALAYAGAKRLPNHIWMSLDEWATWGPMVDQLKATTAGNGGGDSSVTSFAGQLLNTPRTVVPSFASGTTIIGVKEKVEVYEDRFGFLSAVQPKVFGVELAYGGYMASGTLNAAGFAKVTFDAP